MGARVKRFLNTETRDEVYALPCDQEHQVEAQQFMEQCVESYEKGYLALSWFSFLYSGLSSHVLCRTKHGDQVSYENLKIEAFLDHHKQLN